MIASFQRINEKYIYYLFSKYIIVTSSYININIQDNINKHTRAHQQYRAQEQDEEEEEDGFGGLLRLLSA